MREPTGAVRASCGTSEGRRPIDGGLVEARVGLLTDASRTSYCLVQALSLEDAEVKLFGCAEIGAEVALRLGDEAPFAGRVDWIRGNVAGISFATPLDFATLLRAELILPPMTRRESPRVRTVAQVLLRTARRSYPAVLRDISAMGARVRTLRPIRTGPSIVLNLPDFPPIVAFVRWSDDLDIGLAFEVPLPIQVIAAWLDDRVTVSG